MRFAALLAAVLALVVPDIASADEPAPTATGAAIAEKLFVEGRELATRGDLLAACAKFDAAYKLDHTAVGTLLNLALCDEHIGKLASAWARFREVADRSRGPRPDRAKLAETRAVAIEPRLSKVTIDVAPEARAAHPTVRIDGLPIDESAWGTELPIDGGLHTVEIAAAGKKSRSLDFTTDAEGGRAAVRVEPFEDLPAPAPEPTPAPPTALTPATGPAAAAPPSSGHRTTGIALTAGGGAILAAGAAFGVAAAVAGNNVACPQPCVTGSPAARHSDASYASANAFAWVANVAIPAGAALSACGLYLWLTSPSARRAMAATTVQVGPSGRGDGLAVGLSSGW